MLLKNKKVLFTIIPSVAIIIFCSVLFLKISNYPILDQPFGVSVSSTYSDLETLEADSSSIIDGTVLENEYFEYEDVQFTVSSIRVDKVYKGNLEAGETVNLLETGGIINNVEYFIEGDKVLKEDEQSILYLKDYEGPIQSDVKKYTTVGVYQGKFRHENDEEVVTYSEENIGELAEIEVIDDLGLEE